MSCFCAHEKVISVFISEATREIHTTITFEWVQKQFVTRVHTLFYFLHDITNLQMTIKTMVFTHRPLVSLALFTFFWWRHNRLLMTSQWLDICDAITWILISNSLDIDFIHDDIHGILCKKNARGRSPDCHNHFYTTFKPMRCRCNASWVVCSIKPIPCGHYL